MNNLSAICIDPGTKAGITIIEDGEIVKTYLQNNSTKKATKKRKAEPKHLRLAKFMRSLEDAGEYLATAHKVIYEGAQGFIRGKAAVEASHKFRAIIELYAADNDYDLIEIQPNDLKQFALGKQSGEKSEMILKAKQLGYSGNDDNEADSYLIAQWALKHCD